jgi:hypothetical protein
MSQGGSRERGEGESGASLDAQLDRAVPSENAGAFLMVVAGDQPGRVHPLSKNTVILGRNAGVDIRLNDRSVSGEHARIINSSSGYEIEDLSSTNGTYLGARKVMRSRLKNGDRVRIGSSEFAFLADRESDATVALISAAAVAPQRRELVPFTGGMPMPAPPMHHHQEEDEGLSLREIVTKGFQIYQFLRQYGAIIGFLLGVGGTLGFASAFVLPPPAVAVCQVKLSPAPKSNPVGESFQPPTPDAVQFFEGAESAFTNPQLIRSTLKTLGDPAPTGEMVGSIASRLQFSTDGARVWKATFQDTMFGSSRQDPVEFLGTHVQNYLKAEINKTLKVFNAESEFLHNQVVSTQKELDRINAELVQFREGNVDRLPDQATQTYSSRAQMEARRMELSGQIHRLAADVANVRSQLLNEKPIAQTNYQLSASYRDGVAAVNRKLSEARAKGFGDEHPEVKQLLEEKRNLENLATDQLKSTSTPLERRSNAALAGLENQLAGLEGQLRAARAEAGDLDRELQHVRRVVSDLPRVESKLSNLQRAQADTQRLHAQLFERYKKAELQVELERVSVSSRYDIVAAPQMEYPKKKKTILIRTFAGLAIGALLVALIIVLREGRRIVAEMLGSPSGREGLLRT